MTNVNTALVRSTYNTTFSTGSAIKTSYNGVGGVVAAPSARERVFAQEPHVAATPAQRAHIQEAARNPPPLYPCHREAKRNGGSAHPVTKAQQPSVIPAIPKPVSGPMAAGKGDLSP